MFSLLCVSHTNQADPLRAAVLTVVQALDKQETELVCANRFHLYQAAALPGIGRSSTTPSAPTM